MIVVLSVVVAVVVTVLRDQAIARWLDSSPSFGATAGHVEQR
jgi:hypothetical protein